MHIRNKTDKSSGNVGPLHCAQPSQQHPFHCSKPGPTLSPTYNDIVTLHDIFTFPPNWTIGGVFQFEDSVKGQCIPKTLILLLLAFNINSAFPSLISIGVSFISMIYLDSTRLTPLSSIIIDIFTGNSMGLYLYKFPSNFQRMNIQY